MSVKNTFFTLSNGSKIPALGFGTYKLEDGDEAYHAVLHALQSGVRHIDSAIIYRNEKSVGEAIKDSKIPREELFITSKLPPHIKNHKGVIRMYERTLKNLGLDYLDAYIINAPGPFDDLDGDYDEGNVIAYKALEELYQEERVGAIGVSQFDIHHLENILTNCGIVPHINQISFFVGHTQDKLVAFCKKHNIQIQGFSPLGKGYILNNPQLVEIASRYQVSPAQVALRYNVEKGVASIPKATSIKHIEENTMLDFVLSEKDIMILDQIVDDPRKYDD